MSSALVIAAGVVAMAAGFGLMLSAVRGRLPGKPNVARLALGALLDLIGTAAIACALIFSRA